jgi:hypothetical protein
MEALVVNMEAHTGILEIIYVKVHEFGLCGCIGEKKCL